MISRVIASEKLIILKLDGTMQQGFQVTLEIGAADQRSEVEKRGALPAATNLVCSYQIWQESYYALGLNSRAIIPNGITMGSLQERKTKCKRLAQSVQSAFNTWLADEGLTAVRETWLQKVSIHESARVIVRSNDKQIWRLPWHQWEFLKPFPTIELGFSTLEYDCPSTQQHPQPEAIELQILAILGDATGIDVDHDRALLAALPGATVTLLQEPTRQSVTEHLWRQRWDILFFAGHSRTEGDIGCLDLNPQEQLTLDELRSTLRQAVQQGLQLAIFNSCDGLGLALALEQVNIPQMIVMREPVPDRVAQEFLKYFLQAFSGGVPVYTAVRQAREQLEGLQDHFPCATWLPIIWQNPAASPLIWPPPTSTLTNPSRDRLLRPWWHRFKALAISTLLVTGITSGIRYIGGLQATELWAFDRMMQLRPDEPPDDRLLLVEVTEADLQAYGFPISDQILVQLLKKLQASQPRVLGLDIFRDLPQEPGHQALMNYFQQSDRLIGVCKHLELSQDDFGVAPPPSLPNHQVGFNDVVLDPHNTVRRHLLSMTPVARSACQTEYAFSLLVALHYLEQDGIVANAPPGQDLQIGTVQLSPLAGRASGYQREDLSGYQLFLNYRRSEGSVRTIAQRVSLADVLSGQVDPSVIRDRIVLIGVTANSQKDDFSTPYGENIRGLVIHAQMISQILSAVLEGRSLLWVWHEWINLFWISSWSLVGGVIAWRCRTWQQLAIADGLILVVLFGGCFNILLAQGGWVPFVPSAIVLVVNSVAGKILHSRLIDSKTIHSGIDI